jgi:hypothetical protein
MERSAVQSLLLSVTAVRGCVRAVAFNGDLVECVDGVWRAIADGARIVIAGANETLLVGPLDALGVVALPTREDLHANDGVTGFAIAVGRRGTVLHVRT